MFYDSNFLFNYEGKTSGIKNFLFESFVDYNYWYCPPKDLVYRFQQFSSKLYAQKENLLQSNTELASLRDFLLPMLMNGQVNVKS